MNTKLSNAHCAIGVTSFGTSGSGSLKNHTNIGHIIDGADAYPAQPTVIPSPIARPVPKSAQQASKTFTSTTANKKLSEFGEKYDFTFNPTLTGDSQSARETPTNRSNNDSPVTGRVFN